MSDITTRLANLAADEFERGHETGCQTARDAIAEIDRLRSMVDRYADETRKKYQMLFRLGERTARAEAALLEYTRGQDGRLH